MAKICPDCGHEFVQGEWYYDYDSGYCYGECPECGWYGNVDKLEEDEDEEEEIGPILFGETSTGIMDE